MEGTGGVMKGELHDIKSASEALESMSVTMDGSGDASEATEGKPKTGAMKRRFVKKVEDPEVRAKKLKEKAVAALEGGGADGSPVMVLNEFRPALVYTLVSSTGPVHPPWFKMQLELDGIIYEGEGTSKKKAKTAAAEKALQSLLPDYTPSAHRSLATSESETPQSTTLSASQTTQLVGQSPTMILNHLRSGVIYELVSALAPPPPPTPVNVKFAATVDGVRFEGEGSNKRVAKAKCAEAVLKGLFGVECETGRGGLPVYTGEITNWTGLRGGGGVGGAGKAGVAAEMPVASVQMELDFELPGGKNPIMFIHELYPDVKFNFVEEPGSEVKVPTSKYSCVVRVEDFDFYGHASNKKTARYNAAVAALTAIQSAGILGQRVAEKQSKRSTTPKWTPHKRAMFEQNMSGSAGEGGVKVEGGQMFGAGPGSENAGVGKKGPGLPKNAVQKLNEAKKGLAFEDVSHYMTTDAQGQPMNVFTISVVVDSVTYTGTGSNKKQAKMFAAEAALRGTSLWTEEDEQFKATQAEAEAAAALQRAEKIRMSNMANAGSGWKRGGLGAGRGATRGLRAHKWIPGGVLRSNADVPLVMGGNAGYGSDPSASFQQQPDQSFAYAADNFIASQGGNVGGGVGGARGIMGGGGYVGGGQQGSAAGYGPYGETNMAGRWPGNFQQF